MGSAVSLRCPISWSDRMMTGVWYYSARLNASTVIGNMSSALIGASTGRMTSPCAENDRLKQVGLLALGRDAG